jgi:hypothetical protein
MATIIEPFYTYLHCKPIGKKFSPERKEKMRIAQLKRWAEYRAGA